MDVYKPIRFEVQGGGADCFRAIAGRGKKLRQCTCRQTAGGDRAAQTSNSHQEIVPQKTLQGRNGCSRRNRTVLGGIRPGGPAAPETWGE